MFPAQWKILADYVASRWPVSNPPVMEELSAKTDVARDHQSDPFRRSTVRPASLLLGFRFVSHPPLRIRLVPLELAFLNLAFDFITRLHTQPHKVTNRVPR